MNNQNREAQISALLARAIELHEKAGMPWTDAERLALEEHGIDDSIVNELIGEAGCSGLDSILTTAEELRQFTRAILVHQPASSPPAPTGWQPIETAPKDGTEILACQAGSPEVGLILWDDDECCWLEPADEWSGPNWLPTHWQPLPPPPAEVSKP